MTHVMLDIETLGTAPGCVVLSIGAVKFNLQGEIGATFACQLNIADQLERGLTIDPATLIWWSQQSYSARDHAFGTVQNEYTKGYIVNNLTGFATFLECVDDLEGLWAHGAAFDPPILDVVYRKFGLPTPWNYRAVRDTRTLFALLGKKMGDFGTPNTLEHDALQDAMYQADETAAALRVLNDHGWGNT